MRVAILALLLCLSSVVAVAQETTLPPGVKKPPPDPQVRGQLEVLKLIPDAKPELIESSCCGMAGSFGYEASHYDVSMRMAEAALLPAVRSQPDAIVLADGTSCRHQIADGAQRQAVHVARLLDALIA